MIPKIAKACLKLVGIYNPTEEDIATLCLRLNLDALPVRFRPFVLAGAELLHMTLIKPPTEDELQEGEE
tara:strand:+ start:35 stop:241 length:207 start_codon:yes stop_codon:yes gene_type:complete